MPDESAERHAGPRPGETLLEWIARVDPEVLAAAADVDRALLRESLATPPSVRPERCASAAQRALRLRRVGSSGR